MLALNAWSLAGQARLVRGTRRPRVAAAPAAQLAFDALIRPHEARRRRGAAAEREGEAGLVDRATRIRIVREVGVHAVRVTPARKLDVDFVRAVAADACRRTIGKESEHDLLVEDIDGPLDLPLVSAEA